MEQTLSGSSLRARSVLVIGSLAIVGAVALALVVGAVATGSGSGAETLAVGALTTSQAAPTSMLGEVNQNPRQNPGVLTSTEASAPADTDEFNQNPRQSQNRSRHAAASGGDVAA